MACKRDMSQREGGLEALPYNPLRQATGPLGIDQLEGRKNLPRIFI